MVKDKFPGRVNRATFDGRHLIWFEAHDYAYPPPATLHEYDLVTRSDRIVASIPRKFVTESYRWFGADCSYGYVEVCETEGLKYCTTERVSRETGAREPYAALKRADGPDYAIAGDGAVYFARGGQLFRVENPSDRPELIWEGDSEAPGRTVRFHGSTLYVSATVGPDSQLWEIRL
jgi:hypothetical protein